MSVKSDLDSGKVKKKFNLCKCTRLGFFHSYLVPDRVGRKYTDKSVLFLLNIYTIVAVLLV